MAQNSNATVKNNQNSTESLGNLRANKFSSEIPPHIQEMLRQKEQSKARVEEFYNARYNELHGVYSRKEEQTSKEIENIRLELKQLAQKIKNFNQEIYKATLTPIIQTKNTIYYKTFFQHIREVIEILKAQVNEARSWLTVYNSRCKSKGAYMQGMKKQGAQYMFNNERGLATSVG
jgi:hypothetical protein